MEDPARSKALARIEEIATGSTGAERLTSIFKAVLATAPFTGGIASLISDQIASRRQRRLEEFALNTAEDLKRLAASVNAEYVRTDDFAFLFEQCFKGAAEHPQREKLNAFRGVLVNAAIRTDVDEAEKEYFLNLVGTLSVLHMKTLRFMAEPRRFLADAGIPEAKIQGGFAQMLPTAIPGAHLEVIKAAFGDLYQGGLISTDKNIFATMTSAQGLHLLGNRVTDLGRRFIDFCLVPR